VLVTVLVAAFVPYFSLVVNLLGACSNTFAGFILPPIFLLKIAGSTIALGEKAWNVFIILFGLFGGGIATVISLEQLTGCITGRLGKDKC